MENRPPIPVRYLAVIVLPLLFSNCAEKEPEKEPTKKVTVRPQIVGRIASIPADREFVLIQAYGKWTVTNGSILTTQGSQGRAANLLVTGEKLGQYAAADVRSGTLEIGDAVYTVVTPPEKAAPSLKPSDKEVPEVEGPDSPAIPLGEAPVPSQ